VLKKNNVLTNILPKLDGHNLEVTHAASASGLPPLGLDRPVVYRGSNNSDIMSFKP